MEVRRKRLDSEVTFEASTDILPNVATSPAILHGGCKDDSWGDEEDMLSVAEESCSQGSSTAGAAQDGAAVPPDGGWGWFVVFGSFMIHIVADGITYSFGMFVVELMRVFDVGRGPVSFIPSILVGVTLGAGPIASSFTNRYGCRVATIVGAVVAAAGMAASAAANSISLLYVSIGLCAGLGFGLIYLPAIVSVSMYFEKRRAFATGIAVCGSGLGTFIMAPVTEGLIKYFGWRGAFLVLSAIVLTNCLFGALFRPLVPSGGGSAGGDGAVQGGSTVDAATADDDVEAPPVSPELYSDKSLAFPDSANASFAAGDHFAAVPPEIKINGETVRLTHTPGGGATPIGGQLANGCGGGGSKYSEIARMAFSHPVLLPSQHQSKPNGLQYGSHSRIYEKAKGQGQGRAKGGGGRSTTIRPNASGVMFRKDILYGGSLYNIPEYKSNPRRYSRHAITLQEDQKRALANRASRRRSVAATVAQTEEDGGVSESDSSSRRAVDRICGCVPVNNAATKAFKDMMDLSLLKDGVFIMFAVSNFLTSIGFNAPYVYTVDRAKLLNIDTYDAGFLLSVIGIANTLGRIILGYISDRPWVNRLYLYNGCLAVCGIALGLSNFCSNYTSQAVFCAVFGVTSGAYVGLTSVVLVDLLGLDKLTNAFGLLLLFQGIASVMGPPIIGLFYDKLGSYDVGFYFAGAMVFISGIMLFAIPLVSRRQEASSSSALTSSSLTSVTNNNDKGRRRIVSAGDQVEPFHLHSHNHSNKISEADEEEEEEEGWDNAPPMTMTAGPAAS